MIISPAAYNSYTCMVRDFIKFVHKIVVYERRLYVPLRISVVPVKETKIVNCFGLSKLVNFCTVNRKEGWAGNDISRTNVPNVRVAFREETLLEELHLLSDACNQQKEIAERFAGDRA